MSDPHEGRGHPGRESDDGARQPGARPLPGDDRDPHAAVADRLSGYLDGELDPATRAGIDAHLDACAECRGLLDGLRRVVSAAGALGERAPRHDLWPGIAAALPPRGAAREGLTPHVGALEREPRRTPRRRLVLTVPQLAAAAVLLVALTSSATWWASVRAVSAGAGPATVSAEVGALGSGVVSPATRAPSGVPLEIASELALLESVLDSGREVLDPNTVLVLERNLAVIERAIEDSRRALALDPGSDFLAAHLERAYERKLEYLRDVSRIVEFAG